MDVRRWSLLLSCLWTLASLVLAAAPDMNVLWPEMLKEDGPSINVTCRLSEDDQCLAGTWFDLHDSRTGVILARKPCQAEDLRGSSFAVTLKESTPYGQFRCRYRGEEASTSSLPISYRFCSDSGQFCARDAACDNDTEMKFCLTHQYGARTCSKITDRDWCIAEERRSRHRFCPINQKSLCSAIFHSYHAVWFRMYYSDGNCPYGVSKPVVHYMGIGRLYQEPFAVSPSDKNIVISCTEGGPFFYQTVYLTVGNLHLSKVCIHSTNFTLTDELFTNGTAVYDMHVTINRYHLANRLVIFGTPLNLSVLDSNHARCELLSRVGEQFRVVQWWTRKSNGSARFEENAARGPLPAGHSWSLKADLPDEYECHVTITYKTCSPHRKFVHTLTSGTVFVDAGPRLEGKLWIVIAMVLALWTCLMIEL